MKPTPRSISSLLVLLLLTLGLTAFGQKTDSTQTDTYSGLQLALDYGKLFTLASDFESKWSAGLAYQFPNRLMATLWVGIATLEPKNAYDNALFEIEGIFGSVGLNYVIPIDATNSIYFGAEYGISQYEESYTYSIGSVIWPDFTYSESRDDLQADWIALTVGTEKRLKIPHVYLGGTLSLKKLNDYDEFDPVDTYAIPGYGRTFDDTVPAVRLYIKYAF